MYSDDTRYAAETHKRTMNSFIEYDKQQKPSYASSQTIKLNKKISVTDNFLIEGNFDYIRVETFEGNADRIGIMVGHNVIDSPVYLKQGQAISLNYPVSAIRVINDFDFDDDSQVTLTLIKGFYIENDFINNEVVTMGQATSRSYELENLPDKIAYYQIGTGSLPTIFEYNPTNDYNHIKIKLVHKQGGYSTTQTGSARFNLGIKELTALENPSESELIHLEFTNLGGNVSGVLEQEVEFTLGSNHLFFMDYKRQFGRFNYVFTMSLILSRKYKG